MPDSQPWPEVAHGDLLVFSSPVALSPGSARGVDTAFGEWRGEGLTVRADYGLFVDQLSGYRNRSGVTASEASIDGQPARIVAFEQPDGTRFTAAHFPDLKRSGSAGKLTFVVISGPQRSADAALRIVKSIRFQGLAP